MQLSLVVQLSAILCVAALAFAVPATSIVQDRPTADELRTQPIEIGTVDWLRDYDEARRVAAESGKPILLMFQEVPGCDGCQQFGRTALSHPLVVDTIETNYVPCCIYNNVEGGEDERVREAFGEPAWNFQVFRLLDARGEDILPRTDILRTTNMLCEWLAYTFDARDLELPEPLDLIRHETYEADHPQRIELATFAMHCYWVGEQRLGAIDGVLRTRAGWIGEREVVEVEFNNQTVSYAELLAKAAEIECLDRIYAHDRDQERLAKREHRDRLEVLSRAARPVEATEQWYHLRRHPLGHLPLTRVQCTKLNARATYADGAPDVPVFGAALDDLVTARQRANLARLEAVLAEHPDAFDGWYPPTRTDGLWEYRARFERRLERLESNAD